MIMKQNQNQKQDQNQASQKNVTGQSAPKNANETQNQAMKDARANALNRTAENEE
jgi:hypothetical protein